MKFKLLMLMNQPEKRLGKRNLQPWKVGGEGIAILFVSGEMEEVLGMADGPNALKEPKISKISISENQL